ncbi:MAG: CehA/McbA family metallohydrolase [Oceanicaulis sp.]
MTVTKLIAGAAAGAGLYAMIAAPAPAQWDHRYPKLEDFGHHTYLEQHELPILSGGPVDPAPAPDGERLAFAAQGWIWVLDLEDLTAVRVTSGAGVDARPRWSPDGTHLAFVRDFGAETVVVVRDMASGAETVIDTPGIDLDPEFSADGAYLFFTSGESGSLSLMRHHLATGAQERITDLRQVERNARALPGGGVMYLAANGASRTLRVRDFLAGEDREVHGETLTYHLTADAHPAENLIVYSAPIDNAYHLWTLDLDQPDVRHRLTEGDPYALTPAFSADGDHIYYTEADDQRRFHIRRIATHGGEPETLQIARWDYGAAVGMLSVSVANADGDATPARLSIASADGHPVANPDGATYFDSQTGRSYFYIDGEARLSLPAGRYTVLAARGPMNAVARAEIRVRGGGEAEASLILEPVWDADAAGYASADHHVHLNGDGHHRASHDDALLVSAGEDLDLLTPMSWNRWERRIDRDIVGDITMGDDAIIEQGQEIRSHFHGHVGLLGVETPFAPWFWGPSNPTLGDPDLTNGDVFAYADEIGAFATYVHPLGSDADPFDDLAAAGIPLELPADGVLASRMGLELVCAWTSPLGNSELWYRFLNIGRPVAAMSGTDGWVDFHRTPAMGTGRNYVRLDGAEQTAAAINAAAVAGRGFVTTGPALVFSLADGARPGDVTQSGPATWRAELASTVAVDTVEILVNGEIVARLDGVAAGESRTLTGDVDLPEGGWIAVRAFASDPGPDSWPTMHARPFAHSSPIWIAEVGSTDPAASAAAAAELIAAIDVAEARARAAYGDVQTPRMHARFDEAREQLRAMIPDAVIPDAGAE